LVNSRPLTALRDMLKLRDGVTPISVEDVEPKIPYGISSYKTIRQENYYYVDKTRYIPQLEETGKFLFLIRPRRFGKSSLLTVLESYYDIVRKDEYGLLFDGTF